MDMSPEFAKEVEELIVGSRGWLFSIIREKFASASREDREDLAQEASMMMWRRASSWDPTRGSLKTYLRMIVARRYLLTLIYGRTTLPKRAGMIDKPRQEFPMEFDNPFWQEISKTVNPEYALLSYHHKEIHEAVSSLPPKTAEYVRLRFFEGLEVDVIKEKMNISYNPSGLWSNTKGGAKYVLAEKLSHLRSAV